MSQACILVVEDDATILALLAYNLRRAGYEVLPTDNGTSGLETALRRPIDLAIVDLMLPQLGGLALSKELSRVKPHIPIIMLTALREQEAVLEGFRSGAADYITKPFDLSELLARISVHLRRTKPDDESDASRAASTLIGVTLERDTHSLKSDSGVVALKPKEYDLLELLLSDPGHLFTREEIVHRVWRHEYYRSSRTLDVHVRRLRLRLSEVSAPAEITSVRGVGYRIAPLQ